MRNLRNLSSKHERFCGLGEIEVSCIVESALALLTLRSVLAAPIALVVAILRTTVAAFARRRCEHKRFSCRCTGGHAGKHDWLGLGMAGASLLIVRLLLCLRADVIASAI